MLVVEDYAPLRKAVVRGLREAGFAVDAAGDGRDGMAFALLKAYDAIVLDLMLPEMDGLDVLRELRRRGRGTPVLILTARHAVDDRVRGLDAIRRSDASACSPSRGCGQPCRRNQQPVAGGCGRASGT